MDNEKRSKVGYETFLYQFMDNFLVVCPNCHAQGLVKNAENIKIICLGCGYNKVLLQKPSSIIFIANERMKRKDTVVIGCAVDPYFHLPLWLQENFGGNNFWAYNFEHLNFLEEHIEAKLRERNGVKMTNNSLGSRLPKWMTQKNNREGLLKLIEKMRKRSNLNY